MYSYKGNGSKSVLTLGLVAGAMLCASSAQSAPTMLSDAVLDNLTAGSEAQQGSGGAIVGDSATATLSTSAKVNISGEVQASAKALNMVNSSESAIANGVNVWGGETSTLDSSSVAVTQTNEISQEQRRSASMPHYSRPNADTFLSVNRTGSESHNDQFSDINSVTDLFTMKSDSHNTSSGEVDTTISATTGGTSAPTIDTNTGKGIAIAGTVHAELDGGELQFGVAVGGPIEALPDGNDEDFGGINVGEEDTTVSVYGRIIMPSLEIDISGAGCGVAFGSCKSEGTSSILEEELNDHSTLDSTESSEVGDSQFTEERIEKNRSAFELRNAQAEYIVVDDSTLTVTTIYEMSLSGSAQSGLTAMNVVNATGSAVANGVNVAYTTMLNGSHLTQLNVIDHSR